jgi:hypothetical protein
LDPRWPDLVHPAASAIDKDLPVPPERSHMMLGSTAGWVSIQAGLIDRRFDDCSDESLAEWHRRLGLEDSDARIRPRLHIVLGGSRRKVHSHIWVESRPAAR